MAQSWLIGSSSDGGSQVLSPGPKDPKPARLARARTRWFFRITLVFAFVLAGVLLSASTAFADSINIQVTDFQYGPPLVNVPINGHYWYGYMGWIVDQDPGTPGWQVTVTNSKPVIWIRYFASQEGMYPGTWQQSTSLWFNWNNPLPASKSPQEITVCGTINYVLDADDTGPAQAAQNYNDGYYVFTYSDGSSSIVGSSSTNNDLLAGSFGRGCSANYTSDPVNTSSGNATYSFTDLSLPTVDGNLTFTRSYNSQDGSSWDMLGYAWRSQYDASLEFPSTSTVAYTSADGKRETFTAGEDGAYSSPAGETARLSENQDGTYTLTALDQSSESFDAYGRLTALHDRYGNDTTLTYTTSYDYAVGGTITELTGISGPGGRSLTLSYDYFGYLTEVTDSASRSVSYTYDSSGNLSSVTDPNGHTTTYTYDGNHQLTSIQQPKASTNPFVTNTYSDGKVVEQTDALGHTTTLSYDNSSGETTVTDARSHSAVDTWDAQFRLTGHTDATSHSTTLTYNSQGQVASSTDENGHETDYTYDSLGNVVSTTDPGGHETTATYDTSNGNLLSSEDALGHSTTYSWDATGKFPSSVTNSLGTTSYTYNSNGTTETATDANSHTTSYAYNSAGDLTSVTDPLGKVTSYGYDSAGRKISATDANGHESQLVYDAKGNVTTEKDPLAVTDSGNRHQTNYTYDANDNLTSTEDANGHTTSYSYNDANKLTSVEDALSGVVSIGYDATYNRTSLEDENGHTTTFAYDANNKMTGITDPLSKTTGYSYDPAGNLTAVAFPGGNTTTYAYNSDNLLTGVSHSADSTTYAYTYNANHAVTAITRSDGKTWHFSYDSGNRPSTQSDENNSALGTLTITAAHDAVGNLTSLTLGSRSPITYAYNARNDLTALTDEGGENTCSYDDGGRLTQLSTSDGSTRAFSYDAASRITQVENTTGSGTQTLAYAHDANGNVTSEGSTTYTYDALDRLHAWYNPTADETTTYTYDAVGNVTQVQVGETTTKSFTYNAANEITSSGYAYDDNGNLTADGTHTYVYDAENQLVQVKAGETVIASMTYDYTGRRTSLTTSSGTTYFHYANSQLVAESNSSGQITATYNYTQGGDLVSMTRGGNTYYYQTNAHGDVVSVTDSSGDVVATYSYDPWGKPTASTGTLTNPFRYAGYYYDASTGLYYTWHRYYDPDTMRFISADPAYSLTFDRYGYCGDNPINLDDSTGLATASGVVSYLLNAVEPWRAASQGLTDFLSHPTWVSANEDFNPVYTAIVHYSNEVQMSEAGCSWGSCVQEGLKGAESVGQICAIVAGADGALSGSGAGVYTNATTLEQQLTIDEALSGANSYEIESPGGVRSQGSLVKTYGGEGDWALHQYIHEGLDGQSINVHFFKDISTGRMVGFHFPLE